MTRRFFKESTTSSSGTEASAMFTPVEKLRASLDFPDGAAVELAQRPPGIARRGFAPISELAAEGVTICESTSVAARVSTDETPAR